MMGSDLKYRDRLANYLVPLIASLDRRQHYEGTVTALLDREEVCHMLHKTSISVPT